MKKNTLLTLVLSACFAVPLNLRAVDPPGILNYQGRISVGSNPFNGSGSFKFALVDAAGSTTFWSNDDTSSGGSEPVDALILSVEGGLFAVTLGETQAIPASVFADHSDVRLRVWFNDGTNGSQLLTPDQRMAAVGYALSAGQAAGVAAGSITSAMLEDSSVTSPKIAAGAVNELGTPDGSDTRVVAVDNDGLVSIGTNDPLGGLPIGTEEIVATYNVVNVFSVTNTVGSFVNFTGNEAVATSGDLVAIASRISGSVTLIDVSNPMVPVVQAQLRDGIDGYDRLAGVRRLSLSGDLLAISARNENAVTLVDVSNPASPVKLVELIDGQAGWNNLGGPMGVAVSGNLLAITAEFDNAVTLADISTPASPVLLSEIIHGGSGFNNLNGPVSVLISGNQLYIGAWSGAAVTVADISNLATPAHLASLVNNVGGYSGLEGVNDLALSGNLLAIVANVSDTVTLVDMTQPASPVKLVEFQNGASGGGEGAETPVFYQNLLGITDKSESTLTLYDITFPAFPLITHEFGQGAGGALSLAEAYGLGVSGTNLVVTGLHSMDIFGIEPTEGKASLVTSDRVGIGTGSPQASLHVIGNMIVQGAEEIDLITTHFSTGLNTLARGDSSTAMGFNTTAYGDYSTVGGGQNNIARGDNSTVGGGQNNEASNLLSTVGGGYSNTASGITSTVSGGQNNEASGGSSTVGGGASNTASGTRSTVGGGFGNTASKLFSTVGGGYFNTASGLYSTIPGGRSNTAGDYAFAAGRNARANHLGSFVWSDSTDTDFSSIQNNEFAIRANGGMRVSSANSNITVFSFENTTIPTGSGRWFQQVAGSGVAGRVGNFEMWYVGGANSSLTLQPGGNMGVGTTSPAFKLQVNGTAGKPGGGSWSTASDARLKDIGQPFTRGLDDLEKIQPTHYRYSDDNALKLPGDREYVGLIAQNVEAAIPEAIEQNDTGYLHVNNDPILWTMLNGIKELNGKLENELEQKDSEIKELEQRLERLEQLLTPQN